MTSVDNDTVQWTELRALIARRVPQNVIECLAAVPASQLRHLRAPLKALRSELRRDLASRDMDRYRAAYDQLAATFVAGIMCSGTPKEALGWLTDRRLLDTTWPMDGGGSTNSDHHGILALLLLGHRDCQWQRDLAIRLAEWLPVNRGLAPWLITYGLAAWSETDLPTSDGFIRGWVSQGSLIRYQHHQEIREWFAARGWRDPVPHHTTLRSWLLAEPRLAEYVPRLFEVDDIGAEFTDPYAARFGADNEWPKALTALADEKVLDRSELLDHCLAKLLRGDRPGNLRGFVALHDQLAPTHDETASRAGMYIRLAADGAGTVAKIAQSVLKALDAEGRLAPDAFEEVCAAVLARPEKTLATAQLVWADKVLRRDPAQAPALLGAVAVAFSHPATDVQERALVIVGRRLADVGAEVRAQLRDAASALGAALRREAARLLDAHTAEPEEDLQPNLPAEPFRAMPPVIDSPAELAERFAALLAARHVQAMALERVLEGAVTLYRRDSDAVARAFEPLASRNAAQSDATRWSARTMSLALGCLMDVLAGRSSWVAVQAHSLLIEERLPSLDHIPLRRIHEIAKRLRNEPVPCLLATPTRVDGLIDPEALAERLGRLQSESVSPWPDDLEQALLRLPTTAPADIAASVQLLAGRGSDVIALPAFSDFHVQPFGVDELPDASGQRRISTPRVVPVMKMIAAPGEGTLSSLLAETPDPLEPLAFFWLNWNGRSNELLSLWPSSAPNHADVISAHLIPTLYQQAGDDTSRAVNPVLPLLAEAGETSGPVTHLALAYGLTAARPENRTASVDALLALAAQGRLDAELLGRLLGSLWHEYIARPNRFLAALSEAARAGAVREVWTLARALLTCAAGQPTLKGLPDLLALASECAATAQIRAQIPELDDLATRAKPARLAKEVRRLQQLLRD